MISQNPFVLYSRDDNCPTCPPNPPVWNHVGTCPRHFHVFAIVGFDSINHANGRIEYKPIEQAGWCHGCRRHREDIILEMGGDPSLTIDWS
jgi:hypothetical protein